ncbi:MAG: hypothetical protein MJ180_02850 [Candidatus Gastranaerophilales bacterium]|nr:hypothetical protein [Candidatus Gastranaerophilales bacterium]
MPMKKYLTRYYAKGSGNIVGMMVYATSWGEAKKMAESMPNYRSHVDTREIEDE